MEKSSKQGGASMKAGTSMKAGSHCKMMLAARMSTAAVNPHIEYFTPAGLSKSKKCTRKTTFRNDKSSYRCASSCQESTQNKTFIISQLKISKNSPLFCPVNEENTCSKTFSNSMKHESSLWTIYSTQTKQIHVL
jgi:hypothetical protein